MHVDGAADDPWRAHGFLALAVVAAGLAVMVFGWARTAPFAEVPLPAATRWRVYRALLALAAIVVVSCLHDELPRDRFSRWEYAALLSVGIVAVVLLPVRLSAALPLRMRRADLALAIGVGCLIAGAFVGISRMSLLRPPDVQAWLLSGCLLAPVVEELLFRGVLWRVCRRLIPVRATAIVTTIVFTLCHQWLRWSGDDLLRIAGVALAGLLLGALRARTGSVVPGMLAHMLGNALPRVLGIFFGV